MNTNILGILLAELLICFLLLLFLLHFVGQVLSSLFLGHVDAVIFTWGAHHVTIRDGIRGGQG